MEERKLATILFADLVGSTELAGSRDPERTRAVLDRFYEAMAEEIAAAGGTVEKFVGDAVMAAFGAPAAYEDHAERALSAALAMRNRLTELFGDALHLRLGVNTGEVVIGQARVGSSFASGDAVNVAARLEQAAAPGEILVGERTASAARRRFEFGEPAVIVPKGKPDGVACRRLIGLLAQPAEQRMPALRAAFVGRERELETIRSAYSSVVVDARPKLLAVVAEAGAGKTRLIEEFFARFHDFGAPGPLRLTGRCRPYGRGSTYLPLADILREQLGLSEAEPPAAALERLRGREILALTFGLDVAGDLHPRVAQAQLFEAWAALVEGLCAERTVALVVDDLHWAEEPLLDLLEHLVGTIRGPLLVLGTARPDFLERRPGWAEWVLALPPVSRDEAGSIVAGLALGLPASLLELVVDRAEGNPFYLEEFIGMLVDRGVLEHTNGSWSARELPSEIALPDSIQSVLAARIDLLGVDGKAALQAAAVIGRNFWLAPVAALLDGAEPELDALEARDLIRRRSVSSLAGELEYFFKHALTRDVAYGSMTRVKRARLHAAFAVWLEGRSRGGDESAPLLAHHFAEAVDPEFADLAWPAETGGLDPLRERAVSWLRRAAELAVTRYAVVEALVLLDRALAIEPDDDRRVEIMSQKGRAHIVRFDVQGFRDAMEDALALNPSPLMAATIYAQLAFYGVGRPYMWKQPPPPEVGRGWLANALELAQNGTEARAYACLARALSDPLGSKGAASEALTIAEARGNESLRVFAYEAETLAATEEHRYEEACAWADRALGVIEALSDPGLVGHQYWNAGFVYLRAGRIEEVRRLAAACERLSSSQNAHEAVHAVALRVLLESVLGRWDALVELSQRVEALTAVNDDFPCQFNWRAPLVCALGFAHSGEGQDEARRLEELGRRRALVAGPPEREPALLRLALSRGDVSEVHRILGAMPTTGDSFGLDAAAARLDALTALGEAEQVEEAAAPFLQRLSYTHPFALRALGTVRGDALLLEKAAARFEQMGLGWRADETRSPRGS